MEIQRLRRQRLERGRRADPSRCGRTKQDAAIIAIKAGVDLDMWGNSYVTLAEAVRDGRLSQPVIDTAVRRVLRAKFLAGLFDDPYTNANAAATVTLTPENRAASRRVAQRSMILLKNDGGLLPLPKSGRPSP